MSEFLNAAFALPTAFYSISLLFVLAYWMLAIVGLFDLDTGDASVETGGEVDLDGPELDLDLDGPDLDLDGPDLDLDGPELDVDLDGPDLESPELEAMEGGASGMSAFAKVFSALGFHRVPLTVTLSFVIFFGWILCFLGMEQLAPLVPGAVPALFTGIGVGLGALLAAIPPASLAARPLAPVFHIHKARSRRSFIGHECELLTGRVDDRFGQAEIADGGAGQTVQVRCDHDNDLARGGRALVVSFDDSREAYVIEPLHTRRGQLLQQRAEQLFAARKSQRSRQRS